MKGRVNSCSVVISVGGSSYSNRSLFTDLIRFFTNLVDAYMHFPVRSPVGGLQPYFLPHQFSHRISEQPTVLFRDAR